MLLRGSFRLVLELTVAITVAYAVLWVLDAASKLFGTWWVDHVELTLLLFLTPALALGIAAAIACDRAWLRLRALGPKLDVRR